MAPRTVGKTAYRPKQTLVLTDEASELLAKADFGTLQLSMMGLTFEIEFQAQHLVANNRGLFFILFMRCFVII
jgi:hypothetical protein